MKMSGHTDRLLAGSGIDHEQDFLGLQKIPQLLELFDQRLINLLPAGGIENRDGRVARGGASSREPGAGRRGGPRSIGQRGGGGALHILLSRLRSDNRNIDLFAKSDQLFDRRRPLQIAGHQRGRVTLLFQKKGQLGRGRRLAGTI